MNTLDLMTGKVAATVSVRVIGMGYHSMTVKLPVHPDRLFNC